MNNLVHSYALSLFQIAKEENTLVKCKNSALKMTSTLEENKTIFQVWDDKNIKPEQKQKMIHNVFKGYPSTLVFSLIILSRKKQTKYFLRIIKNFISQVNKELNIHEGVIYSTFSLTNQEVDKIQKKVSKLLEMNVTLKNLIDKTLVSGIKIIVEDKIVEYSLSTRIESMKRNLLSEQKGDN